MTWTFGRTTDTTSWGATAPTGKYAGRFYNNAAGKITQISWRGSVVLSHYDRWKVAVYADNNGAPGALLGYSLDQSAEAGESKTTWTAALKTPAQVGVGYYWLCLHSAWGTIRLAMNTSGGTARQRLDSSINTYGSAPSNPFGTATATAYNYCIWATCMPLNAAPYAPINLAPSGGKYLNAAAGNSVRWTFADPDPGDTQSAYEHKYRDVTANGEWVTTGQIASPYSEHYYPPGTFVPTHHYEHQVKPWDAQGLEGPFCSSAFFIASWGADAPTITDPEENATIPTSEYLVTWSTPNQSNLGLRVVGDLDGEPDPSNVIWQADVGGGGWPAGVDIADRYKRSWLVPFPDNGVTRHVQLTVQYQSSWSAWTSRKINVSYTPPAVPGCQQQADPDNGRIIITPSQPEPTGTQPTVTSIDVWRSEAGGPFKRLATGLDPNAPYYDRQVASRVDYVYRIRAYGDNGTYIDSDDGEEPPVVIQTNRTICTVTTTLQGAIDAAEDGDMIHVPAGSWGGAHIVGRHNLEIYGDGVDSIIGVLDIMTSPCSNLVVRDLTIQDDYNIDWNPGIQIETGLAGGHFKGIQFVGMGYAAINAANPLVGETPDWTPTMTNIEVDHCVVVGPVGEQGFYVGRGCQYWNMHDNSIGQCVGKTQPPHAFYIQDCTDITITNNYAYGTVASNGFAYKAGCDIYGSGHISDIIFNSNRSSGCFGGLWLVAAQNVTAQDNEFMSCTDQAAQIWAAVNNATLDGNLLDAPNCGVSFDTDGAWASNIHLTNNTYTGGGIAVQLGGGDPGMIVEETGNNWQNLPPDPGPDGGGGLPAFGDTAGHGNAGGFGQNELILRQFTLDAEANVLSMSAFMESEGGARARYLIFADNGGVCGNLVWASAQRAINGTSLAWFSAAPLGTWASLPAGTYWLGIWTGAGTGYYGYGAISGFTVRSAHPAYNGVNNPPSPLGDAAVSPETAIQLSVYATIEYVGSPPPSSAFVGTSVDVTGGGSSWSLPVPTGLQNGDILIAQAYAGNSVTFTAPAGWTEISSIESPSTKMFKTWWKRANNEGSTPYAFSSDVATYGIIRVSAWRGCKASGNPVHAFSNTAYVTNDATLRAAGVTTTHGCFLLHCGGSNNNPVKTATPPTGYTEVGDDGGAFYGSYLSWKDASSWTGATGDVDATLSDVSSSKHAVLIALETA